ncbi:MAG: hypothetical protein ACRD0P_18710, partial [Stackebrandtia sp.]
VPAVRHDADGARRAVETLAKQHGVDWTLRRQTWNVVATDGGVIAGREGAIERWSAADGDQPVWLFELDGICTQLAVAEDGVATVGVWDVGPGDYFDRRTSLVLVDADSGAEIIRSDPGFPAVLCRRQDRSLLVRDTRHSAKAAGPARILSPAGALLGEVRLGGYDLFNHFFDIQRSAEFLVLVGDGPRPHQNKQVAEVRQSPSGWNVERLFPLAWDEGAHVFGGPGVSLSDPRGNGIIHAGAIHDGAGLLPGNAFVARRRYPDGRLDWTVPLDNQITALDEADGLIVALTTVGEAVGIDAVTGNVVWRQDRLLVNGGTVIPLSMSLASRTRAWIGTLDGRTIQISLEA